MALKEGEGFEVFFEVQIVKAYTKPILRVFEEGIFIVNIKAELLNVNKYWQQPPILQGGVEMVGPQWPVFPRAGESGNTTSSTICPSIIKLWIYNQQLWRVRTQ